MVTPDYERTMFTYLGACEDFDVDDLDFPALSEAAFLHFTGYMWCTEHQKKAIQTAVDFCREKNIRISFDCADPLMVKFYKDEFLSWIPGHVDVLFGNREEISEMIGQEGKDEDIARQAGNLADIVIMKIGAEGCIVVHQGKLLRIPGLKVDAIDTVGAGDAFASGFLYGLLQGRDIETCSILANTLAASIVTVEGCNFMKCDKGTILDGVL
jgi:sugar/nucleoside kinase (ribokinase family)